MFFIKFFYFLQGYVIIKAEGLSLERFISICVNRNIRLLEIDRRIDNYIMCIVSYPDFKKLRGVVRKTKVKITIVEKHGIWRLLRIIKRRTGFFIGALIFPLIIMVMSQFVWSVQVNGVSLDKTEEIKRCLYEAGIKEGIRVSRVPKASDLKFYLLDKFDYLSWAWVYLEGTKVRVEVREGIPIPGMTDYSKPCDIVALRSGLIEEIVTEKGKGIVKKGSIVNKGDVLIAGTVEINGGADYYTVHADGTVRAKTSHTESGVFPLFYEYEKATGDSIKNYTVKLFKWDLPLFYKKEIPFETYSINGGMWEAVIGKGFYLGFGLKRDIYNEIIVEKEAIPVETAAEIAKYELEERISSKLTPGAVLDETNIYTEQIDDDSIFVSLTMNFTENIGIEKEFK